MTCFKIALLVLFICFLVTPACADRVPVVPPDCVATSMQLCGYSYPLPPSTPGATLSLMTPDHFAVDSLTFQCATNGIVSYYVLMNQDAGNCAVKTCKPDAVHFCGASIFVPVETKAGGVVDVPVPANLLAPEDRSASPTLSVQCNVVDGKPSLAVLTDGVPSCNVFQCAPVILTACDSSLNVPSSAPLGAVLKLMTENHQSAIVECMGSVNNGPYFAVTDSACAQ